MILGAVSANLEAIIPLRVQGTQGQAQDIQAIVDTDSNGTLTLPPAVVRALALPFRWQGRAVLADGTVSQFSVFEATVQWDGQARVVHVAEVDTEPLVGMELLRGYELTVQAVASGVVSIRPLLVP